MASDKMIDMKIIVLGGYGQLGTALRKENSDIIAPYVNILSIKTMDMHLTDVDVVINCAANTNVDQCELDPATAYAVNTGGPAGLAKLCKKKNIKLVHISTDFVFGSTIHQMHSVIHHPNPLSVYGRTKLQAELEIKNATDNYLIIRTSGVYGCAESVNSKKPFIRSVIHALANDREVTPIVDMTVSPTYAGDLSKAILYLIENNCTGLFHAANFEYCNYYEFAQEIARQRGYRIDKIKPMYYNQYKPVAKRPQYSALDCNKLRKAGFNMPSWQDGISHYLRNNSTCLY